MTTAELIGITTSLVSNTAAKIARWGQTLWDILSLSLADDRIAPGKSLSCLLESGAVSVAYSSRFLSRMKIIGTRRYPFEEGKYPAPESLASAVALAMNDLKAAGAEVTLVVPKTWAIVKTAEFPLVVKDNLSNVVSYELDRLTPLASERAFYDFRILAEDESRIRIMLVVIKTDTLQPYLDALRERGITVGRVVAGLSAHSAPGDYVHGKGDSLSEGMNLLAKGAHQRPKRPIVLTAILLAALIALCLFWLAAPLRIEEKRIEAIDREISSRRNEVKRIEALKKELEGVEKEIAAIHAFKASRPVMLNLLKEMTQVLPNNAWLSRVRCTESTVDIEGYAASATDIVPKLEASRYFKKVEFASPTFRDARLNADRFIIKMEIEGLPTEKAEKTKDEKK